MFRSGSATGHKVGSINSCKLDFGHYKLGIPRGGGVGDIVRASTALGRTGTANEAAGAMLMLLSPYASYITGQAVEVTGGGWM